MNNLSKSLIAVFAALTAIQCRAQPIPSSRPNVLFLLADDQTYRSIGALNNDQIRTPNLDALASESVNFTHALAGCPVCSPYRASLLTGQHPLTHGVFVNDVPLEPRLVRVVHHD